MGEVMEAEKDRREMGIEEEGKKKQRKVRKTQRNRRKTDGKEKETGKEKSLKRPINRKLERFK